MALMLEVALLLLQALCLAAYGSSNPSFLATHTRKRVHTRTCSRHTTARSIYLRVAGKHTIHLRMCMDTISTLTTSTLAACTLTTSIRSSTNVD